MVNRYFIIFVSLSLKSGASSRKDAGALRFPAKFCFAAFAKYRIIKATQERLW